MSMRDTSDPSPPVRRRAVVFLVAAAVLLCFGPGVMARGKGPPRRPKVDVRTELRFAAKMAKQGLWREALFRWERVLRVRPDDGKLWNNVAVAREAIGDRDGAREAYQQAAKLSGDRKILANQALFLRAQQRHENGRGEPAAPR